MKKKILIAVIIVIVIIIIPIVTQYNKMVSADETVTQNWNQVQVQYQRRADLLPNLVETVKGYAKHESKTLEDIAELRSRYGEAKTPEELEGLDRELANNIQVVVEAYPELKANENFLQLQDELAGTENRIAVARKDYNDSVASYNKLVRRFPGNIFAGIFGFDVKEGFKSQEGSELAPQLSF